MTQGEEIAVCKMHQAEQGDRESRLISASIQGCVHGRSRNFGIHIPEVDIPPTVFGWA